MYLIVIEKKKIILEELYRVKKGMFICEISITVILVYQKLGSVGPVQQKTKLPSSYRHV